MAKDYHELPKLRDSISYIYMEHARIEQEDSSIAAYKFDEKIPIPVSSTTCLLLGPGTTVTHAAIGAMADNGCLVVWCGENLRKYYATGLGETRSAKNILKQAELCMNSEKHLEVAKRMYMIRFPKMKQRKDYSLQQLRGMEGIRVKVAYKEAAREAGISWHGRNYNTGSWNDTDDINRALSIGNALLYNLCQAAIISLGYSTALGFIHTGKQLSFVYDIADLYKATTVIPAAFEAVKAEPEDLGKEVRIRCRKKFTAQNILKRIADDIEWIFDETDVEHCESQNIGEVWDKDGNIAGGVNYSNED